MPQEVHFLPGHPRADRGLVRTQLCLVLSRSFLLFLPDAKLDEDNRPWTSAKGPLRTAEGNRTGTYWYFCTCSLLSREFQQNLCHHGENTKYICDHVALNLPQRRSGGGRKLRLARMVGGSDYTSQVGESRPEQSAYLLRQMVSKDPSEGSSGLGAVRQTPITSGPISGHHGPSQRA